MKISTQVDSCSFFAQLSILRLALLPCRVLNKLVCQQKTAEEKHLSQVVYSVLVNLTLKIIMFRKTLTLRFSVITRHLRKTTNLVHQRQPNLQYSILRHFSQNQVFSLKPPKLQICLERKMSSDQSEIKFEDADLYERFMGVWSKMVGSKFIEWMSPAAGKRWVDIGKLNP